MNIHLRKAFQKGWALSASVIGFLTVLLSLTNLIIDRFNFPLSYILDPLINLYNRLLAEPVIYLKQHLPEIMFPQWSADLTILLVALSLVGMRAAIFADYDSEESQAMTRKRRFTRDLLFPLSVFVMAFLPYVRLLLFLCAGAVLLSMFGPLFWNRETRNRKENMRMFGYSWGVAFGVIILLTLNWYAAPPV